MPATILINLTLLCNKLAPNYYFILQRGGPAPTVGVNKLSKMLTEAQWAFVKPEMRSGRKLVNCASGSVQALDFSGLNERPLGVR